MLVFHSLVLDMYTVAEHKFIKLYFISLFILKIIPV
jgi:hypothetical protein